MKFIFPQNYKFKNKIFGIIDYSTAIINLILYVTIYFFVNVIFSNLKIKIFVFILICFPCFLLSIIGGNHENVFSVLKYVLEYLKNKKIYLYK